MPKELQQSLEDCREQSSAAVTTKEDEANQQSQSSAPEIKEETKDEVTFAIDQNKPTERTILTMTMMDDYMDKNVDQYCTFEDNYFAHHD